mgnify:CR=1 FL=1
MSPILDSIGSVKAFGWGALAGTNPVGSYDSLATVTLSTSTTSLTISGIPQAGYQHLQLRGIARTDRSGFSVDGIIVQFNNDTGSNYSQHQIYGEGSNLAANGSTSTNLQSVAGASGSSAIANSFGVFIMDVLNYTSTDKYKTLRFIGGHENNTDTPDTDYGWANFASILWMNTSSITSITFKPRVGTNFQRYSQFNLYGIRG